MQKSITDGQAFIDARDLLLRHGTDYETSYQQFRWPRLPKFNWALDFFDLYAAGNAATALWVVNESGSDTKLSFQELFRRSNQAANFLRKAGVARGDRIILMLPNVPALWEITLAAIKIGAVIIPTTTNLAVEELRQRLDRGGVRHVITTSDCHSKFDSLPGNYTRIVVDGSRRASTDPWLSYDQAYFESAVFHRTEATKPDDPLFLYFTSGTTAVPKLVLHTHQSYPVGHLITMYWIGVRPGDVHLNISSPGWAKHAWSSFFAPWNAGATIVVHNYVRFESKATLDVIARCGVTTLCAPPTVWRMFVLENLKAVDVRLREIVSAGEPLNPEIIEKVRSAWGVTIRDGFGQTENVSDPTEIPVENLSNPRDPSLQLQ